MSHKHHHKFSLKGVGKAISNGSKEIFHEVKHLADQPGQVTNKMADAISSNMTPILLVGGLVAVVILMKR